MMHNTKVKKYYFFNHKESNNLIIIFLLFRIILRLLIGQKIMTISYYKEKSQIGFYIK